MRALITGVSGQDGHYLSELLLSKGYTVYGLVRRTTQPAIIPKGVIVINGDVTDASVIREVVNINPDEIYHLAAMSFVWESFKSPKATFDINAVGTLNMLEAARILDCKFYQASTSELYGSMPPPQNEVTPFHPRSPYGVAKLAAYWLTVNYRESYDLYAVNGILFNHESPIRGKEFVTRKVCDYVAWLEEITPYLEAGAFSTKAHNGNWDGKKLKLGNLDAIRDWGHAKDYVKGMWLMMQQDKPEDYVLATGEGRTIRDLLDEAFGYINADWKDYVEIDQELYRPAEVHALIGDPSKAESIGWTREYTFQTMIKEMINAANSH